MPPESKKMIFAAARHCWNKYKAEGGTQEALAVLSGMSRSAISEMLTGKKTGRLPQLDKFASAFNLDLAEFLTLGKSLLDGKEGGKEPRRVFGGPTAPAPSPKLTIREIKDAIDHDQTLIAPLLAHIGKIMAAPQGLAGKRPGRKRVVGT